MPAPPTYHELSDAEINRLLSDERMIAALTAFLSKPSLDSSMDPNVVLVVDPSVDLNMDPSVDPSRWLGLLLKLREERTSKLKDEATAKKIIKEEEADAATQVDRTRRLSPQPHLLLPTPTARR